MLFGKRKPRGFNYQPRYSQDGEKIERRSQFDFSRSGSRTPSSRRTIIIYIVLVILVAYLIIFFRRLEKQNPDAPMKVESILVE